MPLGKYNPHTTHATKNRRIHVNNYSSQSKTSTILHDLEKKKCLPHKLKILTTGLTYPHLKNSTWHLTATDQATPLLLSKRLQQINWPASQQDYNAISHPFLAKIVAQKHFSSRHCKKITCFSEAIPKLKP